MAYIQEKRLAKAMQNLYYLGRPGPKLKEEPGKDGGSMAANFIGNAFKSGQKKPAPKLPKPDTTPNYDQEDVDAIRGTAAPKEGEYDRADVDFIRGTPRSNMATDPNLQRAQGWSDAVARSAAQGKANQAALKAPHNGVYTPAGAREASVAAEDNASDIATGQSILEHGMQLEQPVIPQGGDMQNPYTVGMGASRRYRY